MSPDCFVTNVPDRSLGAHVVSSPSESPVPHHEARHCEAGLDDNGHPEIAGPRLTSDPVVMHVGGPGPQRQPHVVQEPQTKACDRKRREHP